VRGDDLEVCHYNKYGEICMVEAGGSEENEVPHKNPNNVLLANTAPSSV
jgi:hypothetical protein